MSEGILKDMEQVMKLQGGEIIPMNDCWNYFDGRMIGMLEERDEEVFQFIVRSQDPTGNHTTYGRCLIENPREIGNVIDGRYHIFVNPLDDNRFALEWYPELDDNSPEAKKLMDRLGAAA